jgi:transposase
MKVSRRELFETIDKPALKPLPERPYEYAEWKKATVNIDYHIAVDGAFYSVPYSLAKEQVEARITAATVEILFKGKRVASHPKDNRRGAFNTLPEHMPEAHKRHLEWSPSRIIQWAAKNGPQTQALVIAILESKKHPEQGYRSCLGIIRLGNLYPPERLEAACARALIIKGYSYKNVASILKKKLDQSNALMDTPLRPDTAEKPIHHRNIRGKDYYDQEVDHA